MSFLTLLLIYTFAFSQEEISLNQAIDIALDKNFQYRISQQNLDYSSKNILQGYLNFAPTLTIDHSQVELSDFAFQQQLAQQEGFKQLLNALNLGDFADQIPNTAFKKVYRSSMTANWNLFAKGLALRELNERKLRHRILEIEADQSKLNTVYSVREAFYTFYIAKEFKKIADLRLENTDKRVQQVKQFVESGLRNNAELMRWQLQQSQAEENVIQAENALTNAKKAFVFVLGMDMDKLISISKPELSESLFTDITADLIQQLTIEELNEMQKSLIENEIAVDNKFYTFGKFLPSVNMKYVKNWQQSNKAFPAEQPWELSLNFSWELFSSFKDYIELQKNEINIMTTELQKEENRRRLKLDLYQLYSNLEKSRKSLKTSKRSVEFAEENYRISSNRYDNGLATTIDLLDSQIQLYQSKLDALQAYRDYVLAGYALKRLLGKY